MALRQIFFDMLNYTYDILNRIYGIHSRNYVIWSNPKCSKVCYNLWANANRL